MILFAADNHYDTHGGKALYERLADSHKVVFSEDDWSCLEQCLLEKYDLIILNLISGTCNVSPPGPRAEATMLAYLQSGKPLLLLHGASAAFWQWDWWRPLVGYRWVRADDPDGFAPSVHPHCAYRLHRTKTRHPLCRELVEVDIPTDELYIELEQTSPAVTLLEAKSGYGTFPMCYETLSPWRGKIVGYIPGHAAEVVCLPENLHNCRVIIDYLVNSTQVE